MSFQRHITPVARPVPSATAAAQRIVLTGSRSVRANGPNTTCYPWIHYPDSGSDTSLAPPTRTSTTSTHRSPPGRPTARRSAHSAIGSTTSSTPARVESTSPLRGNGWLSRQIPSRMISSIEPRSSDSSTGSRTCTETSITWYTTPSRDGVVADAKNLTSSSRSGPSFRNRPIRRRRNGPSRGTDLADQSSSAPGLGPAPGSRWSDWDSDGVRPAHCPMFSET